MANILQILKDSKMRLSFKVSIYTILFSLYVIISASYMYQLFNFIRFDLWIPKKIIYEKFEENNLKFLNLLLKKNKDDDELEKLITMKKSYTYNVNDGYYYLNNKLTIKDKEKIRNFFLDIGKKDNLPVFIIIIFSIFGCILLFYLISLKINFIRIILACIVFGVGLLYSFTINEAISERIHLIFFGMIGFLFVKDNFKELKLLTIIYVILWTLIIAAIDEIFQMYLPYRVGDIRDLILGISGGLWGGIIYLCLYLNINFKNTIIQRKKIIKGSIKNEN